MSGANDASRLSPSSTGPGVRGLPHRYRAAGRVCDTQSGPGQQILLTPLPHLTARADLSEQQHAVHHVDSGHGDAVAQPLTVAPTSDS